MKRINIIAVIFILCSTSVNAENSPKWSKRVQTALENTKQLRYDRGNRLPLYLWPAMNPGKLDDTTAEYLVKELDVRGVGLVCSWVPGENREELLNQVLTVARAQKKFGLRININATSLLYSFFNGDEQTAHIDKNGNPFWEESFGSGKMGCPFAIDYRKKDIRSRVEYYTQAYKDAGLDVDFIFADWEIDGPLEVNRAHETSKHCTRCREHIKNIDDFGTFQKVMREMRSYLQFYAYSEPVLSRFPDALVGNYAVYPNNGYRYWLDYFETEDYVDGQPYLKDQGAKYRTWYNDYPLTGYTFAMPVVYTWYPTYNWYDFDNSDYRWFYNMLLVASNVGKSTPPEIPIISFVHWHTVVITDKPDPAVKQMSEESYQELLWHMLLRGTDTFFMWCSENEDAKEVQLVHDVYAAAQEYGEFLEKGTSINFDVPDKPDTVISGLAMRDRVLLRRTDFGSTHNPVDIMVGTKKISVPYKPGVCQIIDL
ncbi:MAG: hypothetical protein JXB48_06900 [Candidatus Latescibacteria bacterium]|nr:hypothetical protein [Candidatus Latescibacterota bacterium]